MSTQNVETKVVEFQFNNSDFEQNAAKSISTLEKLKEGLQFTDSTAGLEDINKSIKNVNFDNLQNGIEETKKGFSALEMITFGVMTRIGEKIADIGTKLVTFIPKQIVEGGSRRALNMEQAKHQIEGLGQAWEDVSKDVDYAVSGTQYGMDVAAKAASQLMASNVQFGKEFGETGNSPMAKALRGISGVATMTNSSYEEISAIFTKVAGSGRMMAEELNQVAGRGLNAAAAIADFLNDKVDVKEDGSEFHRLLDGASQDVIDYVQELTNGKEVTEKDVRELASQGKINFGIFSQAMDAAFGEHATKANETYAGALSNCKAQLSKIGEIFATPIFEQGRKIFASLYDVIKDIRSVLTPVADVFSIVIDALGDIAAAGIKAIHGFFSPLVTAANAAHKALTPFVDAANGSDFVENLMNGLGFGKVKEAVDEAKTMVSSIEEIRGKAIEVIRGDWGNGQARRDALTEAGFDAETIQKYVNTVHKLTGGTWNITDDILAQADAEMGLTEAVTETGEATEEAAKKQKKAVEDMTTEEKSVGALANVFIGVTAAVDAVKKKFGELPKIDFGKFFDDLATKVYNLSVAFRDFLLKHAGMIANVLSGLVNILKTVGTVFLWLAKTTLKILGVALLAVAGIIGGVVIAISAIIDAIKKWAEQTQIVEKVTTFFSTKLEAAKAKIIAWKNAFMQIPGVSKAIESLKNGFTAAGKAIPNFLTMATKGLIGFGKRVKNSFKGLFSGKYTPKQFFKSIGDAGKNFGKKFANFKGFDGIKQAFTDTKVAAKNTVDTMVATVDTLGKKSDGSLNLFGKVWEGIKNVFTFISTHVGNAVKGVQDFFAGFHPIQTVVDWLSKLGSKVKEFATSFKSFATVQGAFDKFKGAFAGLSESVPKFFGGAAKHVGSFFKRIAKAGSDLIHGEISPKTFVESVKNAFGNFARFFTNFKGFDDFKAAFLNMRDSVVGWLDDMGTNADGTRNIFGKFLDVLKKIFSFIQEKLGILKEKVIGFFDKLAIPELVKNIGSKFKAAFSAIGKKFPQFSKGLGDAIASFRQKITDLGGFKLTNVPKIFGAFKETIGKFFKKNDLLAPLKAAFKLSFGDIKNKLLEAFPGLIPALDKIKSLFDGLKKTFAGFKLPKSIFDLPIFAKKFSKSVDPKFKGAAGTFESGVGGVGNVLSEVIPKVKEAFKIDATKFVGLIIGFVVVSKLLHAFTNFMDAKANASKWKAAARGDGVGTTLLKMAGAIAIVALVIAALSQVPNDNGQVLKAAGMVGLILLALAGTLIIIDKVAGKDAAVKWAALGTTMLEMSFAIGIVALVMAALTKFEWDAFWESAKKLGIILLALVGSLAIMSFLGPVTAIGAAAALGFAGSLLMIVQALVNAQEMDPEKAASNLATAMTSFCEKIKGIEIDPEALAALEALGTTLGEINTMSFWSGIGEFIVNALPGTGEDKSLTERFSEAVGVLADTLNAWNEKMGGVTEFAEIPEGTIKDLRTTLTKIGWNQWGGAILTFLSGAGDVEGGTVGVFKEKVGVLADTLLAWNKAMTNEDGTPIEFVSVPMDHIGDFTGALSMVADAQWGTAIVTFFTGAKGVVGGSVGKFAEKVAVLAGVLKYWNKSMGSKDGKTEFDPVEVPLEHITNLTEALKIVGGDGLLGAVKNFVLGDGQASEKEVESFSTKIADLASIITTWNTNMTNPDGTPISNIVEVPSELITNLANTLKEIPTSGLFGAIAGLFTGGDASEEEVESFKTKIKSLGEAINAFSEGFANVDLTRIEAGTGAIKALAKFVDVARGFEDKGKESSKITGIIAKLPPLGTALAEFTTNIGDSEELKGAAAGLRTLTTALDESLDFKFDGSWWLQSDNITTWVNNVEKVITTVLKAGAAGIENGAKRFKMAVDTVNSASAGEDNGGSDAGKSMAESAAEGITNAAASISTAMTSAIASAANSINTAQFKTAGTSIAAAMAIGIARGASLVKTSANKIARAGVTGASSKNKDIKEVGKNFARGFANGTNAVMPEVRQKAEALARAALKKMKETLDVKSPSRETYKIGKFFGLGFSNAIEDYTDNARASAEDMAKEARSGLARAAHAINRMISDDLDTAPQIRPVLDLSEIQNGAFAIGNMLNTAPPIGLSGNISAINSSVDSRRSASADILDAIDSMRSVLADSPHNTYVIDGITYDDGSNISSAVETIIREARMERRV